MRKENSDWFKYQLYTNRVVKYMDSSKSTESRTHRLAWFLASIFISLEETLSNLKVSKHEMENFPISAQIHFPQGDKRSRQEVNDNLQNILCTQR